MRLVLQDVRNRRRNVLLFFSFLLNFILAGMLLWSWIGQGPSEMEQASVSVQLDLESKLPSESEDQVEVLKKETTRTEKGRRTFCGGIEGSIYNTLLNSLDHEEAEVLSAHLSRNLMWDLTLAKDILPGDEIRALYEYDGEDYMSMKVLASWYESSKHGKRYLAFRYKPERYAYASYFDLQGREVPGRMENSPLKVYEQVTSLLGDGRRHKGVDFKTPVGTTVLLPFKAKVLRRNWHTRYNGYCLEVEYLHDRVRASFLHLNRVGKTVVPGKIIEAGAKVGETGNTGTSTGPHLDYRLKRPGKKGGRPINPFGYHKHFHRRIDSEQMAKFKASADEFLSVLRRIPCNDEEESTAGLQ